MRIRGLAARLIVLFAFSSVAVAQVGLTELIARLGAGNEPTGAGVGVGQVEAGTFGSYGPDQSRAEFVGKTFTPHSGPPGSFGHATTVARNYYGDPTSIAPGVTDVHLWTATGWTGSSFLLTNLGGSIQPLVSPAGLRVFNNSWIGSGNNNGTLRRADHVINRDGVLIMNGVNNGSASSNPPLMSHSYNGIAVGRSDGNHGSGPTQATADGPGRMKPEIVAPAGATSFSTPIVGAAAALLFETAQTDAGLSGNSSAERPEVIKAALLAGATHRAGWSNNPDTSGPMRGVTAQPLDPVFGVDEVNVDRSHLILTGAEQDADSAPPAATNAARRGWDFADVEPGASRFWRFRVDDPADQVSVIATWNRTTDATFSVSVVADFDLLLHGLDGTGALVSLVGPGGLAVFGGGNVVSESTVDNVEHLFVTNLEPGAYVLELRRMDAMTADATAAVAWLLPGPPRPGSGEDFELETQVNGGGEPLRSDKTAVGGDRLQIGVASPGGTFVGVPPVIAAQLFAAGSPPTGPATFPEIHLTPSAAVLIVDPFAASGPFGALLLPPEGLHVSFDTPPGTSGVTLRAQGLALAGTADNGIFAATRAHDIVF